MTVEDLCAKAKEKVALELQQADPAARESLLLAALYEVSRTILPELGLPRKSQEYQKARDCVLELVSSIAIPLVRGGGEQGIAVFSELSEGCADPLLKKKLSVYAQQLLAQSRSGGLEKGGGGRRIAAWSLSALTAGALAFYLFDAGPAGREGEGKPGVAASMRSTAQAQVPLQSPPLRPRGAEAPPHQGQGESLTLKEREAPAPAPPIRSEQIRGEQVTPVRLVNGQLLVPVTLRHGGVTVKVELVVDTGATRSVVHEAAFARLPIDLRSARTSVSEVADGSLVRSRVVRVELLKAGPFAHPSMELEVIPFAGGGGHDGLLGMDFLGKHPHQIDMEHQLIRWF